MINHEHKFIFIHIPKCAGMSIGKTLTELTKPKDDEPHYGTKWNYSGFKIHHDEFDEKIWKEYFVFTFIRDPIDRLLSQYFYRDFLYHHEFEYAVKNMKGLFSQRYGYREPGTHPTNGSIMDIADYYGEWIHYPGQRGFLQGQYSNGIDKRPYIDFYGKYETLQEDFDYVCEKVGLPKTELPHHNKSENDKDFEYERKLLEQ